MSGQEPLQASVTDVVERMERGELSGRNAMLRLRAALSAPSPRATEGRTYSQAEHDESERQLRVWQDRAGVTEEALRAALARPADPVPGTDPQPLDVERLARAMADDGAEDPPLWDILGPSSRKQFIRQATVLAERYARLTEGA